MLRNALPLLVATSCLAPLVAADSQQVLAPHTDPAVVNQALVEETLKIHDDPVDAYLAIHPEAVDELRQPRLMRVAGAEAEWLTEGDKMRLRRKGLKFIDITDHTDFYEEHAAQAASADKPRLPDLKYQRSVKPLFPNISTDRMREVLGHLTSYFQRSYWTTIGEESSVWIHDYVDDIIRNSPFHTHISLEYFTHRFPQSSIIARFEPKVRNFSAPVTVIGAHQDSANYVFPLLAAPGADDDGSGSVSILEAFRVLAESGFVPKDGPVEFHWYAAEEGGLLGSQPVARFMKESGRTVGAMMEFDMTAFVARNATETIGLIRTEANEDLTDWVQTLATEYLPIEAHIYDLGPNAGSDYMSFTQLGFPASFASEGNPMKGGFPGEYDPYVHGIHDTMDIDDERGVFSFDHMARFSELAIAFAIEQGGWDNQWR
ncbi:peptidase family m28 domain-containing protein [Sarocladium implicatum]|nr:peptidase family m28 domain-containing protein [Sarocladium implicatum]